MGENGRLTTRQRRFLVALLASPTVRDAAALAGIGENTAYRYLRDDALRRALHEAQDAMLSEAARWALQRVLVALDVLAGIPDEMDRKIIRLWREGATSGAIAEATGYSEGHVRNKITALRKRYGKEAVPLRRV